jgi:hypothetical protein
MDTVAVRRLKLVAPAEVRGAVTRRIEDGLRLSAPASRRLLLIRRLPLGALPVGARASRWAGRIDGYLRAAASAAVHGVSPGAEQSLAVWFHSADEMRAALLRAIARGESPTAWFWKVGMPDWDGSWSPASAAALIAQLGRSPEGLVAMAKAIVALAEDGRISVIVAALDRSVGRFVPREVPPVATAHERVRDAARGGRLLARLPSLACLRLEAAVRTSTTPSFQAQWLVEAALVAAAPTFAAEPILLARTAAAWIAARMHERPAAVEGRPTAHDGPRGAPRRRPPHATDRDARIVRGAAVPLPADPDRMSVAEFAGTTAAAKRWDIAGTAGGTSEPELVSRGDTPTRMRREIAAEAEHAVASPHSAANERWSAAAGVLLLVGPLEHLGFPAWLAARPALAAEGFGCALFREIADRMRVPIDDPLRTLTGEAPPAAWRDSLAAWRIGLDRWLRRRARIRLSDVARKPGWLLVGETGIDVRFRPDAADIRLRRHALDIDPGWVPWLGLALHYHYRAEPLA